MSQQEENENIMALVLPDAILQQQTCSECYQYLSVPPISITASKEKVCGRCLPGLKSRGEKYFTSLFSTAVEDVLFKCVNHLDGCNKVMSIREVQDHEKNCHFQKHECFLCSFHGNWSQILNHCHVVHPDIITNKFYFSTNKKSFEKKKLLVINSEILLLTVKGDDAKLAYSIQLVNSLNPQSTLNECLLKFYKPSKSLNLDFAVNDFYMMDLNSENYFEKNIDSLISDFGCNEEVCCKIIFKQFQISEKEVELKKRFLDMDKQKRQMAEKQKQLTRWERNLMRDSNAIHSVQNVIKKLSPTLFNCQKCKKISIKNARFCPSYHCYCDACFCSRCSSCEKNCQFSKMPVDFENVTVSCDWPQCQKLIPLSDYLLHRPNCSFRPYQCPLKCGENVYSPEGLKDHWHCESPKLVDGKEIECNSYNDYEYYWLINGDLYHVLITYTQASTKVLIEEESKCFNKVHFEVFGYCPNYQQNWQKYAVAFTDFCGKMMLTSSNTLGNGWYYTQIKISLPA